jgi:hypothetical protein
MVTVLCCVGLERNLVDGNSVLGCVSGMSCVGWYLCCRVWVWKGMCWVVTVP